MVGLPCLVSQWATLYVAGWTWAVFTRVYLESCISISPQSGNFLINRRADSPWSLVNHNKSNYKGLKIGANNSKCIYANVCFSVCFSDPCVYFTQHLAVPWSKQLPTSISEIMLNTNKANSLFEYVTSKHTGFKRFISKCNLKNLFLP
jgi:hypothetical protein